MAILLLIPSLVLADCSFKGNSVITVLDSFLRPASYTVYEGYDLNWMKNSQTFYISVFDSSCKKKQYSGKATVSITINNTTNIYSVSFLNGVSSPIVFLWKYSGAQTMLINISTRKSNLFLNKTFLEVHVPNLPFIYSKEQY